MDKGVKFYTKQRIYIKKSTVFWGLKYMDNRVQLDMKECVP